MNCKRAKVDIALWIGGDLGDAAELSLRQHLGGCPSCDSYRQQMKESLRCLQEPSEDSLPVLSDSVWPGLSSRLSSRESMWSRGRFNGWVPATMIAVSCMVIFYSAFNSPIRNQSISSPEGELIPLVGVSQRGSPEFPPDFVGNPVFDNRGFQPDARQRESDSSGLTPPFGSRPIFVLPLNPDN